MLTTNSLALGLMNAPPPVNPDYDAPFYAGINQIASWVLAGGLGVLVICGILAAVALGAKGTPERARTIAENWWFRIVVAILILGSFNGLFAFIWGFDFGF
tara:strand:- start:126 stop:428 length:303 start_codon:yes stop_codon:yes gene_type:complete